MNCKLKLNNQYFTYDEIKSKIVNGEVTDVNSINIENATNTQINALKFLLNAQKTLIRTSDTEEYYDDEGVLHEPHTYLKDGKKAIGVSEAVRQFSDKQFDIKEFAKNKRLSKEEEEELLKFYKSLSDKGTEIHKLNEDTINFLVKNPKSKIEDLFFLAKNENEKIYLTSFYNYIFNNLKIDFEKDIVLTEIMVSREIPVEVRDSYDKTKTNVVAGTIDLLVIKPNGKVIQYDYKTSKTKSNEWSSEKQSQVAYQQEFYKNMANSNEVYIIPIKIDLENDSINIDEKFESKSSNDVKNKVNRFLKDVKLSSDIVSDFNEFIKNTLSNYTPDTIKSFSKRVRDAMKVSIIEKVKNAFLMKWDKIIYKGKLFSPVTNEQDVDKKADEIIDSYEKDLKNQRDDLALLAKQTILNDLTEDKDITQLSFLNNETYQNSIRTQKTLDFLSKYADKNRYKFLISDNVLIVLDEITKAIDFISLVNQSSKNMIDTKYDKVGTILSDLMSINKQKIESKNAFLANVKNVEALKLGYLLTTPEIKSLLQQGYFANNFVVHSLTDAKNSNYLPQYVNRVDIQKNLKYLGIDIEISNRDWISFYLNLLTYFKSNKVFENRYNKFQPLFKALSESTNEEKVSKTKEVISELKKLKNEAYLLGNIHEQEIINRIILQLESDFDIDVLEDLKEGLFSKSLANPNDLTNKIAVYLRNMFNRVIDIAYKEYTVFALKNLNTFKKFYEKEGFTALSMVWNNRTETFRKLIDIPSMTFKDDSKLQPHQIELKNEIKKIFKKYLNSDTDNIPLLRASTTSKFYDSVTDLSSYLSFVKERISNIMNYESRLIDKIDKEQDLYLKDLDVSFFNDKLRQEFIQEFNKDIEHNLEIIVNLIVFNKIRQKVYEPFFNIYNSLKYIVKLNNLFKTSDDDSPFKTLFTYFDKNLTKNLLNTDWINPEDDEVIRTGYKLSETARYITSFGTMSLNYSAGLTSLLANTWRFFTDILGSNVNMKSALQASTVVLGNLVKGEDNTYNIGLVNLLNSYYRISSIDLDNLTRRHNMSYKGFNSSIAYFLSSVPDYYFRMTFFVGKMIQDGTFKAHFVENGELVYKVELDERFNLLFKDGKLNIDNLSNEGKVQYALYQSLLEDLEKENGIENGKPKYAYSERDRRNHKDIADKAYGSIDLDVKNEFSLTIFGKAFSQLRTYLYGLKDRYYLQTKTIEDNIIQERKLVYVNNEPKYIWQGKYQEGIIQTLFFMYSEFVKNKNLFLTYKELLPEQKQNLTLLLRDLMLAIMLYLLGKAMFENNKDWRVKAYMNSIQDLFILNTLRNNIENFAPASYTFTADLTYDMIVDITGGFRNDKNEVQSKFFNDFALIRLFNSFNKEK